MDLLERSAAIAKRFDHLFLEEIGVSVSSMPADVWATLPLAPSERYGFMWPVPHEDSAVVGYCADVIAVQTKWMNDEALDAYLDLIEYLLSLHVADVDTPVAERIPRIEDTLWDVNPDAMQFLSEVQMRVLTMREETPGDNG